MDLPGLVSSRFLSPASHRLTQVPVFDLAAHVGLAPSPAPVRDGESVHSHVSTPLGHTTVLWTPGIASAHSIGGPTPVRATIEDAELARASPAWAHVQSVSDLPDYEVRQDVEGMGPIPPFYCSLMPDDDGIMATTELATGGGPRALGPMTFSPASLASSGRTLSGAMSLYSGTAFLAVQHRRESHMRAFWKMRELADQFPVFRQMTVPGHGEPWHVSSTLTTTSDHRPWTAAYVDVLPTPLLQALVLHYNAFNRGPLSDMDAEALSVDAAARCVNGPSHLYKYLELSTYPKCTDPMESFARYRRNVPMWAQAFLIRSVPCSVNLLWTCNVFRECMSVEFVKDAFCKRGIVWNMMIPRAFPGWPSSIEMNADRGLLSLQVEMLPKKSCQATIMEVTSGHMDDPITAGWDGMFAMLTEHGAWFPVTCPELATDVSVGCGDYRWCFLGFNILHPMATMVMWIVDGPRFHLRDSEEEYNDTTTRWTVSLVVCCNAESSARVVTRMQMDRSNIENLCDLYRLCIDEDDTLEPSGVSSVVDLTGDDDDSDDEEDNDDVPAAVLEAARAGAPSVPPGAGDMETDGQHA